MAALDDVVYVNGTAFHVIEAPAGMACWVAEVDVGTVTGRVVLMIEPAAPIPAQAVSSASVISERFNALVAAAADFLREQLRSPKYGLSAGELSVLDGEPSPFEVPQAVVRSDGSWMLHFMSDSLSIAQEYGIGVNFSGMNPESVEDMSQAEPVATEDDG